MSDSSDRSDNGDSHDARCCDTCRGVTAVTPVTQGLQRKRDTGSGGDSSDNPTVTLSLPPKLYIPVTVKDCKERVTAVTTVTGTHTSCDSRSLTPISSFASLLSKLQVEFCRCPVNSTDSQAIGDILRPPSVQTGPSSAPAHTIPLSRAGTALCGTRTTPLDAGSGAIVSSVSRPGVFSWASRMLLLAHSHALCIKGPLLVLKTGAGTR